MISCIILTREIMKVCKNNLDVNTVALKKFFVKYYLNYLVFISLICVLIIDNNNDLLYLIIFNALQNFSKKLSFSGK